MTRKQLEIETWKRNYPVEMPLGVPIESFGASGENPYAKFFDYASALVGEKLGINDCALSYDDGRRLRAEASRWFKTTPRLIWPGGLTPRDLSKEYLARSFLLFHVNRSPIDAPKIVGAQSGRLYLRAPEARLSANNSTGPAPFPTRRLPGSAQEFLTRELRGQA